MLTASAVSSCSRWLPEQPQAAGIVNHNKILRPLNLQLQPGCAWSFMYKMYKVRQARARGSALTMHQQLPLRLGFTIGPHTCRVCHHQLGAQQLHFTHLHITRCAGREGRSETDMHDPCSSAFPGCTDVENPRNNRPGSNITCQATLETQHNPCQGLDSKHMLVYVVLMHANKRHGRMILLRWGCGFAPGANSAMHVSCDVICRIVVSNNTIQCDALQGVMTHCIPECPLQKEAPLAKVVNAVAVLLARITAGSKEQCSCTDLHR